MCLLLNKIDFSCHVYTELVPKKSLVCLSSPDFFFFLESRESFGEKEQSSRSAGYRKRIGSSGKEATISKIQTGHQACRSLRFVFFVFSQFETSGET